MSDHRPRLTAGGLRLTWWKTSSALGWRYPDDWFVPEVDTVCELATTGGGTGWGPALTRLGRARAEAGADLVEVFDDLTALYRSLAATPTEAPLSWVRPTALGWADVLAGQVGRESVIDGATGLARADYLRVRLAEVYRDAAHRGVAVSDEFLLVVVRPGSGGTGLAGLGAMAALARKLRVVYTGGQTLAVLGTDTAVVLDRLDGGQAGRGRAVRLITGGRPGGSVRVWDWRLPDTYEAVRAVLDDLAP